MNNEEKNDKKFWVWYDTFLEEWFSLEQTEQTKKDFAILQEELKKSRCVVHETSALSAIDAIKIIKGTSVSTALPFTIQSLARKIN